MSAREVEREVEQRRAALDMTIDRLQHRLSPFGLADEALGFMRSSRMNRTGDAMMSAMRRDPVPALLIAAGIGLLLYRATQPSLPRRRAHARDVAVAGTYPPPVPADAPPPPVDPVVDPRPISRR